MAISKTASLTFEENQQQATSYLHYAASLNAVKTFAAAIQAYSVATIIACSYTEEENDPGLTAASGTEALEFQAIIKMQKPSGSTGTQQIAIPGPDPAIFDFIQGAGYRVKQSVGEDIAAAYSTLMGQTYTFLSGWLTN